VLLVNDRGNDETAGGRPPDSTMMRARDHRRNAAFHVLGAAAVETAVELDRVDGLAMQRSRQRVDMPAQHQHAPGARPSSTPTTFDAGRDFG